MTTQPTKEWRMSTPSVSAEPALPAALPPGLDRVIPAGNTERVATVIKTVKLPPDLAAALARTAKAGGRSESELIREGIERVLERERGLDMRALLAGEIGIGRGPGDLSSNRERMRGYGRSRHR